MTHTTSRGSNQPQTNLRDEPLQIDFLYWEDCPSHERALKLLKGVIKEEGVQAHIDVRQVDSEEEAAKLRFPGSPTIRVNGYDIDENPALPIGLACRVYHHENGKISPLPSRGRIAWAIREATRQPQLENPAIGTRQ